MSGQSGDPGTAARAESVWRRRALRGDPGLRAVALGLGAALLVALAPAPGRAAGFGAHLRESPWLLGDPGGVRQGLARLGVTLQLFSHHLGTWRIRGGAEPGSDTGHSASADLLAVADLEELAGWRGGTLLLHLKSQYDRNVNASVGALSDPYDDADFDEALYVDELWLQQGLAGERLRLRVGFQEQQTVFDRNAFANSEDRQFLATALDNDPVVPLPNGLAVNAIATLAPWLELAAGVADADNAPRSAGFDTAFDDLESLGLWVEATARVRLPGPRGGLEGAWRLGVFRDGAERAVIGETDPRTGAPRQRRGHWGVYLSADQVVWRDADLAARQVGLFLRAALADGDVVGFPLFVSSGAEVRALVPGRPEDAVGLGVTWRRSSSSLRDVRPDARHETGLELYYAASVLPWLVVTPDLQVILDPGGAPEKNAVLAALRLRVTW